MCFILILSTCLHKLSTLLGISYSCHKIQTYLVLKHRCITRCLSCQGLNLDYLVLRNDGTEAVLVKPWK